MRSEAELRAFVREDLAAHLEAWRGLRRFSPPGILDALGLVATVASCFAAQRVELAWLFAGWLVLRTLRDVMRVRSAFKQEVLSRLFEFALPGVDYRPGSHVGAEHVEASGLFPESWNRDSGEDYVHGRLGETDFWFSELRLVREGRKDRETLVFRGLFFIADFHKSFRGRTYLLPDVAERVLGVLGRSLQALPRFDGTDLVELEDPDFEKRFVCHSTDPVEARYVLSTSLVQRILRLAERASGPLRVSFVDECMYLALPLSRDLLPAAFLAGSASEEALLGSVRELFSVVGLVEELGLNTRIWSKGPKPAPTPA
ncbi:MAG TPA: DUF3137 domain-containing protein [Myxococcota bacterium]|nr:DUF3137 domain-containing protein [Myxococcota bacterium]